MRLILRLKSNKDISQKAFLSKYYSAMNGHIYNILSKNKDYSALHEEKGFKGFCFGNIYPVSDQLIKENEDYSLVISSPLPKFIEHLFFSAKEGSVINLGEGSFTVAGIEARNFLLKNSDIIETMSILNLISNENGKPVLFEREPEKYLKQLKINLIKKYNHFRGKNVSLDFSLFENVEIKQIRAKKNSEPYSIPIIVG